jgi:tyrosine decarboxylase/aspartate 1-decarboxylase
MKYWKRLTQAEQDLRITEALQDTIDFRSNISLGIPASKLDPHVFYEHASFLKDAPLLRAYVQNPNHIGCHTLGDSEAFFKGTQQLEKELIELVSTDILQAEKNSCDGYVSAGGTEANIQAAWIYRNYFMKEYGAKLHEIALLSSVDAHYSVAKAANLLQIKWLPVPVDAADRTIISEQLNAAVNFAKQEGIKYFIVIANMGTTMFGSVDDPDVYCRCMEVNNVFYKLHVDGAFGGFIYPISNPDANIYFSNPNVSSITLDAHKMLQAPYGTGIFIPRKGLMKYVHTREAQYVNGMDITLSGSRSGANAIAIWMILSTYGPYGWLEKINKLLYRTGYCCTALDVLGVTYFRQKDMNIITIKADHVSDEIVERFGLVPDTHEGETEWYKIVVMDHVELEHLEAFINAMAEERQTDDALVALEFNQAGNE